MPHVMTTHKIPERLALLIAEFDRSGIGELRVTAPDFQLHLRAGKEADYSEQRIAAAPADPQ